MSKLVIFFLAGILIYKLLFQSPAVAPKTCLTDFCIDQIVVKICWNLTTGDLFKIPNNNAKNSYSTDCGDCFLLFVFNHIFKTQFSLNHCKCTSLQVIRWIISPDIIHIGIDEKI